MEAKGESLEDIVSQDPDVHSGDLVFAGTRVPARFLPECLKAGQTLEEFLADYPTVSRGQAERLLGLGMERVEADLARSRSARQ